jgi:hypothetical protein
LSSHLHVRLPSVLFPCKFFDQNVACIYNFRCACYMPWHTRLSCCNHGNGIRWSVQITALFFCVIFSVWWCCMLYTVITACGKRQREYKVDTILSNTVQ